MDIPVLAAKVTFKNNTSPKSFAFEDTTDYASFGVDVNNMIGVLKATGPAGVFYNNTNFGDPDIDGQSSLIKSGITLPLDTESNIQAGGYVIRYTININEFSQTGQVFTYNNTAKTITIDGDWRTQYNADDAQLQLYISGVPDAVLSPTDISYDSATDKTTITLASLALVDDPADLTIVVTYTLEVEKEFTYTYAHVDPEVKIEATANCDCAKFKSIDNTQYGANESLTRTHTIIYPATSGQPNYVSSAAEIILSTLWTKNYSVTISSVVTYLEDGLYVETTLVGQKDVEVKCDAGLCRISTCIKNVYELWLEYLSERHIQSERVGKVFFKILSNWMLYSTAKTCGDDDSMQTYLNEIQRLSASCNCGCGCTDDNSKKSVQVVPLCGESAGADTNVIVQCLDSSITIDVEVVGNDKTYTLSINQSIVQGIVESTPLDDLGNVTTTSKVANQVLVWNGTDWVNKDLNFFEATVSELEAATESNKYGSPRRLKTRIVHPYSALVAYKIGQYVDWENDIYKIIGSDTIAGETPATDPDKFAAVSPKYKRYVAKLFDASDANPTVTVLENTLGQEPDWSFEDPGQYLGVFTNLPQAKACAFANNNGSARFGIQAFVGTSNEVNVLVFDTDTQAPSGPLSITIEIRLYP